MESFPPDHPFRPIGDDTFEVNIPVETRLGLLSLAEDLVDIQTTGRPEVRRLFPTAYADDPDRDAGYQIFARDLLVEKRKAAVEIMRKTIGADTFSGEELSSWMGILNDYRLVLGTMLDVCEDDDPYEYLEIAPVDDTEAAADTDDTRPDRGVDADIGARIMYDQVGLVVGWMVDALHASLPETDDPDGGTADQAN